MHAEEFACVDTVHAMCWHCANQYAHTDTVHACTDMMYACTDNCTNAKGPDSGLNAVFKLSSSHYVGSNVQNQWPSLQLPQVQNNIFNVPFASLLAYYHAHNQYSSMCACTACMHEVFSMPAVHACSCMHALHTCCMHAFVPICMHAQFRRGGYMLMIFFCAQECFLKLKPSHDA